jgi:rhodanese-related sulfurtransferase
MQKVLSGDYKSLYDNVRIFDCRHLHEFNGGHIKGALNYPELERVKGTLFNRINNSDSKSLGEGDGNTTETTLVILHCEYSVKRGPLM